MSSVQPVLPENVALNVQENSGQIAIGNYVVQIGSVHGGVVNITMPAEQSQPRLRPTPILMRPRRFPGLLDRKPETNTAVAALRYVQPVEYYGASGWGKTSLLRHLAHHLPSTAFPDGVIFLAARQQPVSDLLQFLFDAFYESDSTFKPTEPQLRQALQSKQAIILLDDLDLSRPDVQRLLDVVPECAFFLVSPDRRLWGEGRAVELGGLPEDDAVTLFERELGQPLTTQERPLVIEIVLALNGHPLHLLQAAALVRERRTSLSELARHVRKDPTAGALAAEIVAGLSDPEQKVMKLLAALSGTPLSRDHLIELTGLSEPEEILETLVRRRLVQAHSPRYSTTGNLGQTLAQMWELSSTTEEALNHFADWAEQNRQFPERLLSEIDTILQLQTWAAEAGRWLDVLRFSRVVETPLALAKRWGAWEQVLLRSLQAGELTNDRATIAYALHQLGTRALCLGDTTTARSSLNQALHLRHRLGDQGGAAVSRHNLNLLAPPPAGSAGESGGSPPPSTKPPSAWSLLVPALLVGTTAALLVILAGLVGLEFFSLGQTPPTAPPVGQSSFFFATVTPTSGPASATPVPKTLTPETPAPLATNPTAVMPSPPSELPSSTPIPPTQTSIPPTSTPIPPSPASITPSPTPITPSPTPITPSPTPITPSPTPVTPTATRAPRLGLNPVRLDFEPYPVGSTTPARSVFLINTGGAPLRVTSIGLNGFNPGDFLVENDTCSAATLNPGGSCTIWLSFRPSAPGSQNAELIVIHTASGVPERLPLGGRGLATRPDLVISGLEVIQPPQINEREKRIDMPVRVIVDNQGDGEAEPFEIAINCLVLQKPCLEDEWFLIFNTQAPLPAGEQISFSGTGYVPLDYLGETATLIAEADPCPGSCRVTEIREDNNTRSISVQLPATNFSPEVEILVPETDGRLQYDGYDSELGLWYKDVTLVGNAIDPEDGVLGQQALVWTTNLGNIQEPVLGFGSKISTRLYSNQCTGVTHTITLMATDKEGNQSSDVRTITIWTLC
jgi:hypothetical protein